MTVQLNEYKTFKNDNEFKVVKTEIEQLVRAGALRECGLDPSDAARFIELYEDDNGNTWRLGIPDHAFRGFLEKAS